jgi:fatty-acyl-CoA synthase
MLEIRAPSILVKYFADEDATRQALTEDGYFRTGDLGYTQSDGRFVFLSRIGDVLRLSGFLVSPLEIEEIVAEHASIAACQVVGTEAEQGSRAVAFVLLRPGVALDELSVIEHCRARMARYKVPLRIFRVDEFPTTVGPNGVKVRKEALRELARELCSR